MPPVRIDAATPGPFSRLAIADLDGFIYGVAPRPVSCGRGVTIGAGEMIPEINFTLPPIDINPSTWDEVRTQYSSMIEGVCRRAVALHVPALVVEFETLPPMTVQPEWGAEITRLLADALEGFHARDGLKSALRLTPNDTREHQRPPVMRSGPYWEGMERLFDAAAGAGADMIGIESTGGKEIHDIGLMNADLRTIAYALGVLAPRDMEFLWDRIVHACRATGITPSGDTACGFANTALALADQRMIPSVLAALVRVAAVPRSLVAYERGALGPSKDCAYEGPYMKAIAGVPISMEGRSAACAHLSPIGNVAQAVCDCWSNESVLNVRLLSTDAPIVSLEQLAYDCRLANTAAKTEDGARQMRDWLTASDAPLDPQAWVLRPDVVLRLSAAIVEEPTAWRRTRRAIRETMAELRRAHAEGSLRIAATEKRWLDRLSREADGLPEEEDAFICEMRAELADAPYLPEEYGL